LVFATICYLSATSSVAIGQENNTARGSKVSAETAPIAKATAGFIEAYNKGEIKTLMNYFASDARLITVDGEVFEGTGEIQGLFEAGLKANPGIKMTNDLRSIRLISNSVALESGFTSTTTKADKRPDTIAYHIIHVLRQGQWKIFDVIETEPAREPETINHAEKLAALDFLVGDWVEDAENAVVHHRARWSVNHNYLLIEYLTERNNKMVPYANQRIGWDAKNKAIRSWLFEEDGGHASGLWTQSDDGGTWTVKTEAILDDGRLLTATTRITRNSNDQIEMLMYDRAVEGKSVADSPARRLTKKPPAPAVRK
ncbi:MAG: YybH family protein, partial [bacterium]